LAKAVCRDKEHIDCCGSIVAEAASSDRRAVDDDVQHLITDRSQACHERAAAHRPAADATRSPAGSFHRRRATQSEFLNDFVDDLLQAKAISFCQIDSCRLGGVNEVLAVLLLAAKYGVPVCPHAGGVGLCEYVQHLSIFDYIAVSGSLENRVLEYVDHLHEHFLDPVTIRRGRYQAPTAPGYSIQMHAESLERYAFPDGPVWRERRSGR
jgi:hypothetical protein